jgi:hypothetical protein
MPSEGCVWATATASGHGRAFHGEETAPAGAEAQWSASLRALRSLAYLPHARLGEAGCDAWTLARIAGHSSIAMSARYVHPSQDAVMNIFSRLQTPKELPSTTQ